MQKVAEVNGADKARNEAGAAPSKAEVKKSLGQKIEAYGLIFVAIVTAIFYLFWIVLFCVGATRVPHM